MSALGLLQDLATRNRGIVTRRHARDAGVADSDLRTLVRRGAIARLSRGVYQVGDADIGDPRSLTERYRLALSCESAAAWYGVDLPRSLQRIVASAARSRGRRRNELPGVELQRSSFGPADLLVVRGVLVTSPQRTVIDLARRRPLAHAVVIADGFLRTHQISWEDLMAAMLQVRGAGRNKVLQVAQLLDPLSGSVLESLCRILLWQHDLMPPASQVALTHRSTGWRGRVDFAWPELRVVLECDGREFHSSGEAYQNDRRRWSTIARCGWRVVVVTWFDVTQDPDYVVALVRDALEPDPERLEVRTIARRPALV